MIRRPGSQSKVPNLDLHIVCQEHVPQLEVPVYDAPSMDVGHALRQLVDVVAHFRLGEGMAVLHHVHQRLHTHNG